MKQLLKNYIFKIYLLYSPIYKKVQSDIEMYIILCIIQYCILPISTIFDYFDDVMVA